LSQKYRKVHIVEYEVDCIVNHRTLYNRREYRVRWKGYNNSDNDTLETNKTLHKVRNLVKEYNGKLNSIEVNTTNKYSQTESKFCRS